MSNPNSDGPLKPVDDELGAFQGDAGQSATSSQPPVVPAGPVGAEAQAKPNSDASADPAPLLSVDTLQRELAEAKAKADEHYDAYVRARAEMENVRRRAQDDVAKAHKFSIESFAESLLPVRDSLEMALRADKVTVDTLREGVEVTLKQLSSVFERNRLQVIDPNGQKFDPNLHQAISMVPGTSVKPPVQPNHVVSVLQKGYLINDRILRPALVTVAQS